MQRWRAAGVALAAALAWLPATASPTEAQADPVIAAAGDIACSPSDPAFHNGTGTSTACAEMATSDLLTGGAYQAVLPLGDEQYQSGTSAEFAASYDPSWGREKSISRPIAGNHEYKTPGASGYFGYFGAAAGDPTKGYYSYNVGAWHLIALNSNCTFVSCAPGSAQDQWLQADLALHSQQCLLAYFHHPHFASDGSDADGTAALTFWNDLYAAGADLIVNGHEHSYERFAPQDPSGNADVDGVTEFIVGSGGEDHEPLGTTFAPNSLVHSDDTFGVLGLTLHPSGWDFTFNPVAGKTFTDSGSGTCHHPATAPDAAGAVKATPLDGGAAVKWRRPASDGGSHILYYRVTTTPKTTITKTTASVRNATLTGLTNGTSYVVTVVAVNVVGPSPPADSPPVVPGA